MNAFFYKQVRISISFMAALVAMLSLVSLAGCSSGGAAVPIVAPPVSAPRSVWAGDYKAQLTTHTVDRTVLVKMDITVDKNGNVTGDTTFPSTQPVSGSFSADDSFYIVYGNTHLNGKIGLVSPKKEPLSPLARGTGHINVNINVPYWFELRQ